MVDEKGNRMTWLNTLIEQDLKNKFEEICASEDRTLSQTVRMIVRRYVEESKR